MESIQGGLSGLGSQDRKDTALLSVNDNFVQIICSLNSVFSNIESSSDYSAEDLKFFEKAVEALLTDYWEKFDPYKGRVFRNKLQNRFKDTDKNDTFVKIRYYKLSLKEAVAHLNNRQKNKSFNGDNQVNSGFNHPGSFELSNVGTSATALETANRNLPEYYSLDRNLLGFGSGDLIYSRSSNTTNSTAAKRLKIEDTVSFPRLGADIFTNDLQISDQAKKNSSASEFLNYPNFNPKLRRFNQDLSKNNVVSSVLNYDSPEPNNVSASQNRSTFDNFDFNSTNNILSSMGSGPDSKYQIPSVQDPQLKSVNSLLYSPDVYEFVSALNNLKNGKEPQLEERTTQVTSGFHKTPNYINSLKESFDFTHGPDSNGSSIQRTNPIDYLTGLQLDLVSKSQLEDLSSDSNTMEEKVFKCNSCSLCFKRNSDLKRHVKIHLTLLPHICNNCGKSFARKDALKRHFGTLTCNRNKDNMTYIENLKYLTEEEKKQDLSVVARRKKKV